MSDILIAKNICLERDAHRCRHCGTTENVDAFQLVKRDGRLSWQLSNLISLCLDCYNNAEESRKNKGSKRVGVILCGGRGSRLFPATKFQNKHTLVIGLIPMLMYPLKTLRAFGVYRVLMVIDREESSQIIDILGSGKEFGMDISYKVQEGAGGISEALYLAKDFVEEDSEIFCILGDNIFDNDSLDTDFKWETGNKACVFTKEVSNPQDYGVAVVENGAVKKIVEKPSEFVSNLCVVGLYIYNSDVFSVIDKISPSERGELEISTVNDHFASVGQLQHHMVTGYWADCGGSIQRYCEASLYGAKKSNVTAAEIDGFRSVIFGDK